ncbi:hypothetical protein [Flavobacterium sp.]|uniref:hypothetical protein n=1 Tax=Flavobacterium sp. TaxID=239 RepID=UPI00352748C4
MKKITFVLMLIGMITLQSCEGPEGPAGRDGYTVEAEVIEVGNVNFTPQNNFEFQIFLNPPTLPADKILIYRLIAVDGGQDVWKLCPEYHFFEDGTLSHAYNYDFTRSDVLFYMEGFDLAGLSTSVRTNQIFRVVIIPGYGSNFRADFNDYNQVMTMLGLSEADVKQIAER